MSKEAEFYMMDGKAVFSSRVVIMRINYRLRRMHPPQQLYYNSTQKGYFIRPRNHNGETGLGVYAFCYLVSLGELVDMWTQAEKVLDKAIDYQGTIYPQEPLPPELSWDKLDIDEIEMLKRLQERGFDIIPPHLKRATNTQYNTPFIKPLADDDPLFEGLDPTSKIIVRITRGEDVPEELKPPAYRKQKDTPEIEEEPIELEQFIAS